MTVAALADAHYVEQSARVRVAVETAQRVWQEIPLDALWERWEAEEAARLTDLVLWAQTGAAGAAAAYIGNVAAYQGLTVPAAIVPAAFTSPPDELRYWLTGAPARVSYDLRRGVPGLLAKRRGLSVLTRTVGTLVQDAGREGDSVGMLITPGLDGYYRKLRPPSCDRCAILAGRYYDQKAAFLRHDNCDCVHVPVADHDEFEPEFDPEEMVRRNLIGYWRTLPDGSRRWESHLSQAEREAILSGEADMNRIVNAKRAGMRTTRMHGRRKNTPHQLLRKANGDPDRYRALMKAHGYIRDE